MQAGSGSGFTLTSRPSGLEKYEHPCSDLLGSCLRAGPSQHNTLQALPAPTSNPSTENTIRNAVNTLKSTFNDFKPPYSNNDRERQQAR